MKFLNTFIAISLVLLTNLSQAAITKVSGVTIKDPIYLGESETSSLNKQLLAQKFSDETFNVVFRCNKYKRTPSSPNKTVNCIAVSVVPTEN